MLLCVRRVSAITFIKYAQSQKIKKTSNLKVVVSKNDGLVYGMIKKT